jgi:hypothetical protein
MYITTQIRNLLCQICALLESMGNEQYSQPVSVLLNASIGHHTRQIIEFYLELFKGYDQGVIDYDHCIKSQAIESDRLFARQLLLEIVEKLAKPDKELWLIADLSMVAESVETLLIRKAGSQKARLRTNYQRELVYNLEHTIHHMALLQIGAATFLDFRIPEGFGVALSSRMRRV